MVHFLKKFLITTSILILLNSNAWATNEDFIGTFTGTSTNTFSGCGAGFDGTYTGVYTTTSSNLSGSNFDATGTDTAVPAGVSTPTLIGTWVITGGNTASGVSGTVNDSSGVVGIFTFASLTIVEQMMKY